MGIPYLEAHFYSSHTFLLICGAEATSPINIMVLSWTPTRKQTHDRNYDLEPSRREGTNRIEMLILSEVDLYYSKRPRSRALCVCDLILKVVGHV